MSTYEFSLWLQFFKERAKEEKKATQKASRRPR
jgi:hypothetical protein